MTLLWLSCRRSIALLPCCASAVDVRDDAAWGGSLDAGREQCSCFVQVAVACFHCFVCLFEVLMLLSQGVLLGAPVLPAFSTSSDTQCVVQSANQKTMAVKKKKITGADQFGQTL